VNKLTTNFQSLPEEYQHVIRLAQDTYQITIAPLQLLVGGWSGAVVYLVSISNHETKRVEHCILKVDRKGKNAKSDEVSRHNAAIANATPEFTRDHIAELVFERVEHEGAIAIFYRIAGQSLLEYRPLSNYERQSQLQTIFTQTNTVLLEKWNTAHTFEQAVHPQEVLEKWLGFRLNIGGNIEHYLQETCNVNPDTTGLLINGHVFLNPLSYSRKAEHWGKVRSMDVATGSIHGDLNTNNILVKFSENKQDIQGYYLIDFALFKDQMPLLYDQRYLEMSYLLDAMSQVSFAKCVNFLTLLAVADIPDPYKVPIEMSGVSAVIGSARSAFGSWAQENHPSLHDDLWGQYWLAGVAAGLAYCHKAGQPDEQRLAGLIFACANLRRYANVFKLPLPTNVESLYDENQTVPNKSASGKTAGKQNLPSQLTAFIGRETELASLKTLLADGNNRLITIVAQGGMGKTRLSLEAARQMLEAFPQGVYFVALDRITSADLIVQAVATVLPISLASNEDPKSRVLDYLQGKTILLVMDNFEHVLDGAAFVQEILVAAPRVQILASSRLRLSLTGETVFNVEGLAVDEGELEKNSALQLFAQCARRLSPNFELNSTTLPTVTKTCRMVDGMPLAIVLAAAWIDALAVDEIAAEIEKSLDMLETEKRDVPERQRSVRGVIESSWNQVDATAQTLLKRLSVFRGGFTRTAAEEGAGASLRSLSRLVDKALLRRHQDTGRYSMHELLRQYAEEQLKRSAEEERAAHEAHAKYFADFMKARWTDLRGGTQRAALLEIEADMDNIRIAWNYWLDKQDSSRLPEFIDPLWLYFEVRTSLIPAIQLFDTAAQKLTSNAPDIVCLRAQFLARRAWFTGQIGLPEEGLRMAEENINILRQHNQEVDIVTLGSIPVNAIWLNKIELLSQITQEMAARVEPSGNAFERFFANIWWAYGALMQNQVDKAYQTGDQWLANSKELDNPYAWAWSEGLLGVCAMATGDSSSAKSHYLGAIQQAEKIGFVRMLLICSETLGALALKENDIEQAQQFSLRCLRITQECGQTREVLASLRDLASVYVAQGNLEQALQLLAIVLNHPTSEQNSLFRPERLRDEAEKLRAEIESQLAPPIYQAAWEAGQRQRLADVVAQLLH